MTMATMHSFSFILSDILAVERKSDVFFSKIICAFLTSVDKLFHVIAFTLLYSVEMIHFINHGYAFLVWWFIWNLIVIWIYQTKGPEVLISKFALNTLNLFISKSVKKINLNAINIFIDNCNRPIANHFYVRVNNLFIFYQILFLIF